MTKKPRHKRSGIRIEWEKHRDVMVFRFKGVLDHHTVSDAERALNPGHFADFDKVVFDLTDLDYLSSACARAFLPALQFLRTVGGDLKLCGVDGKVKFVFELLGFDQFLHWRFETATEAIAAFDDPIPPEWQDMFRDGLVASRKGRTFHFHTCHHARRIGKADRVTYLTGREAQRAGKKPCKRCKPL